jgi:ribonuclease HII
MKSDYETLQIIEDEIDEPKLNINIMGNDDKLLKNTKKEGTTLQKYYVDDPSIYEIGVDEVGRGPLFGRVYTAAVILPKYDTFDHSRMKDSKKFHSKKKIIEVSNYIKENALAWEISYKDELYIDQVNILQATQHSMHVSIKNITSQIINSDNTNIQEEFKSFQLLIDGNYFNPCSINVHNQSLLLPHLCIEGGDNKYTSIAAASILAKVARDEYIEELVKENPDLIEKYGIDSNKGYGAKKHMDGIKTYGITKWHRKTFGICKSYI